MNLSYWSHGGEGVSWRKWAPFHPSATLRRVQFKSRNRLWGRNTGGKVGEMNFFALCLANCCPSRRFWVARSTPMDRGWPFLFTRGCPRRESGNVRRKGIQVRSSLCCISDSFFSWCLRSFLVCPFVIHTTCPALNQGGVHSHAWVRVTQGNVGSPPWRSGHMASTKQLGSACLENSLGVLLSWSHLSKALSQFPICNMKRNNIYLSGLSLELEKICVEWLEFTQYLFNL